VNRFSNVLLAAQRELPAERIRGVHDRILRRVRTSSSEVSATEPSHRPAATLDGHNGIPPHARCSRGRHSRTHEGRQGRGTNHTDASRSLRATIGRSTLAKGRTPLPVAWGAPAVLLDPCRADVGTARRAEPSPIGAGCAPSAKRLTRGTCNQMCSNYSAKWVVGSIGTRVRWRRESPDILGRGAPRLRRR
jgi:hypothetical protein